ncbi:serine threonine- kinase pats1 [Paramuricea clavata]|uniref:Serine threonine- kinase pats1 n=1 Tax=Paramuricea clavata TaxID=317549 RepID=A0A7D9HCA7_PARCT|nr:serine threonine- kinase pats1 [Paramuricea clavata]
MADRFVHGNEPLDSTSDDSIRSSVVQNDQIITQDDQASISQENMAHECDSTNTNQNVFDREQNSVENSVTLADYHVEHQQPTFENRHQIGRGMVDLRQNVVDNRVSDTGTSCDNVVDRTKRTVEDHHQSASGMVDRRQSTVEYTDMDHMVNCQDRKNSTVDRHKATVEDTNEKSAEQRPSVSQVVDATSTNHIGYHEKSSYQDSQSMKTGNLVDRQKRTVEDDIPTTKATEELWKIQLHIDTECSQDIINQLPTSKCFEWNKSVIFGRGDVVDIFVNHEQASRNHVELIGQTLPNGQVLFMTRNISTSKGYHLNRQYITDNNQWMPLNKGNQIKIAGLTFTVDIIPAAAIMRIFVIEFILPQVHHSPVVTIPSPVVTIPSPVTYRAPYLSNGQSSFYHPVPSFQPFANPHGNFVPPQSAHGNYVHPAYLSPTNGMPMQPYLFYSGILPPGQPYVAGNPTNITGDMVEHALQPYQEREGYVNIRTLRYLAHEAVGEWKALGRALGLKDWQLTMINGNYPEVGEKSYQMLMTWVCSNPIQATLENLKIALEDMLVGRGDLAVKYCTSVQNNDTNVQNNGEENTNVPDSTNDDESHSG